MSATILITDDTVFMRTSLKNILNANGFDNVVEASNGQEAVGQYALHKPSVVLMDITMPVMDGYATTAWLRDNFPAIRVLALSTMDSETAIIKMIKNGAKGYILKDAEPDELKLAFAEVLNRGYFYNELVSRKVLKSINQLMDAGNRTGTFVNLSEREIEFLKYVCTELTYKEIADKLFVSVRTVEGYRDTLCEKLNLKTRVGLAMYTIRNNIVI